MKIDPKLGIPEGQPLERVGGTSTSSASKAGPSKAQNTDQASLSNDAVKLSSLSAALTKVPEVRQERVTAIGQALLDGSYSVSDQQIAQAMVRDYRPNSAPGN